VVLLFIYLFITWTAVLASRQFVDMSRIRIEGLLAAFPKLVGTGKQHTYVETENVRYVYQPIEALYLLLITNKQSNILEDLDTLRLLSKLVSYFQISVVLYILLSETRLLQLRNEKLYQSRKNKTKCLQLDNQFCFEAKVNLVIKSVDCYHLFLFRGSGYSYIICFFM
jgi:hypothetical protein